jgi:hypothetical protein
VILLLLFNSRLRQGAKITRRRSNIDGRMAISIFGGGGGLFLFGMTSRRGASMHWFASRYLLRSSSEPLDAAYNPPAQGALVSPLRNAGRLL